MTNYNLNLKNGPTKPEKTNAIKTISRLLTLMGCKSSNQSGPEDIKN